MKSVREILLSLLEEQRQMDEALAEIDRLMVECIK